MYCVIQKIENKKANPHGDSKKLIVSSVSWINENEPTKIKWTYYKGEEKFERPRKDAYKISVHKSYRENGKVKKKQWVICTMVYYDLIDWPWYEDHCIGLKEKLRDMELNDEQLSECIYSKLQPLIDSANKEFEQTEEYKARMEQKETINRYNENKKNFEEKYGYDTYDYCYDVFGTLRNEEYLNQLKQNYETQQRYKKSSYHNNKGGYQEDSHSNYSYNDDFSSYFKNNQSNYNQEDKEKLKKIYKALAMKFHPDVAKDDGEMMKFINSLKEQWNI